MANWQGSARSNYFAVKDEAAFREWATKRELTVATNRDHKDLFALLANGTDDGGWPTSAYVEPNEDNDPDGYVEFDIVQEVADSHLADGHVAVFLEVGAEKLRYVTGFAVAINNKGERKELTLGSIYDLATPLGDKITEATH